VTCTASDTCGTTTNCGFTVTVAQPPLVLAISRSASAITLHWTNGNLEQSSNLLAPWSDVPSASPPTYSTAPSGVANFYRLRWTSP
jgi:hypothetical protein